MFDRHKLDIIIHNDFQVLLFTYYQFEINERYQGVHLMLFITFL